MSRFLYRLGRAAAHHRWRVLICWVLLVVGLIAMAGAFGGKPADSFTIPGTESQKAQDLLKARFPAQSGAMARVVFAVKDGKVLDPTRAANIDAALTKVAALPHVKVVTDLSDP